MKSIIVTAFLGLLLALGTGCKKDDSSAANDFDTPATAAPAGLVGNWASGFASMTQLIDVYTGKYAGNAWVSGKFFRMNADGKRAEFYYAREAVQAYHPLAVL